MGDGFYRDKYYINIIKKYTTGKDPREIFNRMNEERLFTVKISFECDDEICEAEVIDKKCECGLTIVNHEYWNMYAPNFLNELSEYNNRVISEYFDSESKFVLEDIKINLSNIIPFIGSGISKSLGLPLWLELFSGAKKNIPTKLWSAFDIIYESKNVDKIIDSIFHFNPLINTVQDLKKDLIAPEVNKKISNDEIGESVIPDILRLGTDYIITTNYDKLIEKANLLFERGYDESRNINSFQGFQDLNDKKYIFHLHGTVDDYDSMVVTKEDYKKIYGSEKNKKIMSGILNKYSMLFLGFSMNDQYFSEEFGEICESNKGYCKNYYVMINGNREAKNEILKTTNIKFVNIKNESYDVKKEYQFMIEYILGNIYI